MLGKDLVKIFSSDPRYRVFGLIKQLQQNTRNIIYKEVDLRNAVALKKTISEVDPEIIIHCAAIVDLNACEENHSNADSVHVEATKILSSFKNETVKFIYISTDSVFDGIEGNYSEEAETHPLNYYAKSKREGEKVALENNKNSLVIRTNIYGFHTPPGNSLAEWAIKSLSAKKDINGFTDVIFNPLYTKQLALLIKDIVSKKNICGILNVGSKKPVSKYDFLRQLAKSFSLDETFIHPVQIKDIRMSVKRPNNTSLDTVKIRHIMDEEMPTLRDGLEEFAHEYPLNGFDKNNTIL